MSSVLKSDYGSKPAPEQNPAMDFMNAFRIEDYTMQDIYDYIAAVAFSDEIWEIGYGYSDREAVCKWVYDHLETIEVYIPKGYPRDFKPVKPSTAVAFVATIVPSLTVCVITTASILIYIYREKRVIRYAQLGYLGWFMGGEFIKNLIEIISKMVTLNVNLYQ